MLYKSNIIRKRRNEMKMTQEQLAEVIGVARQTIAGWEKETQEMKIDALPRLADILDCDIDYLLGRQEQPRKEIADASEVTGLSYKAIKRLKYLHNSKSDTISDINSKEILSGISEIIVNGTIEELLLKIRVYIDLPPEGQAIKNHVLGRLDGSIPRNTTSPDVLYLAQNLYINQQAEKMVSTLKKFYKEEKNHAEKE